MYGIVANCMHAHIHTYIYSYHLCHAVATYVNLISGKRKHQRKESSDLESDFDSMSPANCIVYEVPITLEFTLLKN